jgi:hypothetical protein
MKIFSIQNLTTLILVSGFVLISNSCASKPPEEKAIKMYMEEHMNDPKSYTPLIFNTLRSGNENVIFSALDFDGYKKAFKDCYDELYQTASFYISISDGQTITQIWNLSISLTYQDPEFPTYDSLNSVMRDWQSKESMIRSTLTMKYLALSNSIFDKIREHANRLEVFEKKLDQEIERLYHSCPEFRSINRILEGGCVIWHSFRGKNKYGALEISKEVFILSDEKDNVICTLNLDNSLLAK